MMTPIDSPSLHGSYGYLGDDDASLPILHMYSVDGLDYKNHLGEITNEMELETMRYFRNSVQDITGCGDIYSLYSE